MPQKQNQNQHKIFSNSVTNKNEKKANAAVEP